MVLRIPKGGTLDHLKFCEESLKKYAESLVDEIAEQGDCRFVDPEEIEGERFYFIEYGKSSEYSMELYNEAVKWFDSYACFKRNIFSGNIFQQNRLFLKWRIFPEFKKELGRYFLYFRVYIGIAKD